MLPRLPEESPLKSLVLALGLAPAVAHAWPENAPVSDDSRHPAVLEAGRLVRERLRTIRPDVPAPGQPLRPAAVTMETHGNILVVRGDEGEFDVDWTDPRQLSQALYQILISFYEQNTGRNPHFLVVNTTFLVASPAAFYQPYANNVRGIGYGFDHDTELFTTPGVALNGIIFMNSYRSYLQSGPIGRFTFNQEIGHRWGTFLRFIDPVTGGLSDELLGRDCSHWSFFANSDNSSMEGNVWEDIGNGRFRSVSGNRWGFSPLDLYLMGFAPKEAVGPIWYIRDPESWSCVDAFRNRRYNPRWEPPTSVVGQQVEVEGTRVDVAMDDIIAAMGERDPDHATARRTWSALFLLVARQNDRIDDRALEQLDSLRLEWERAFEQEATMPGFPGPDLLTTLDGARTDPPPPEGLGLGERCVRSEDCAEGLDDCIGLGSGVRVCTVACTAESPCGDGFCCTASLPGNDAFPWYCIESSGEGVCSPVPFEAVPDAGVPDALVPDVGAVVVDAAPPDATVVEIDRGSGGDDGCQTSGRGGHGWLALVALAWTRRRRRGIAWRKGDTA
jgi:uncharacterized protein (TIGR03382 family)